MKRGQDSFWQYARFYTSVAILNVATLLFMTHIFQPFGLGRPKPVYAQTWQPPAVSAPAKPIRLPISGKPIRLIIDQSDNGLHIDLPVKDGVYDAATNSWTLGYGAAYFALSSMPANDTAGVTFIYGHNEKEIFSYISALHQNVGAYALVYTDTGKVFRYLYQDGADVDPGDTSVFRIDGPPTLIIQTCSGSWFELRHMYRFSFERIEPSP